MSWQSCIECYQRFPITDIPSIKHSLQKVSLLFSLLSTRALRTQVEEEATKENSHILNDFQINHYDYVLFCSFIPTSLYSNESRWGRKLLFIFCRESYFCVHFDIYLIYIITVYITRISTWCTNRHHPDVFDRKKKKQKRLCLEKIVTQRHHPDVIDRKKKKVCFASLSNRR